MATHKGFQIDKNNELKISELLFCGSGCCDGALLQFRGQIRLAEMQKQALWNKTHREGRLGDGGLSCLFSDGVPVRFQHSMSSSKSRPTTANSPPLVLSAFSGAGGLDLGLESAGFKHLGFIENERLCQETVTLNRPHWNLLPWDDVHVAAKECRPEYFGLKLGELDLLAGAPPCQPFSTAAQWSSKSRRGLADERANTLGSFLELVTAFLPKVVLMENVPSFWKSALGAKKIVSEFFEKLSQSSGVSYRLEARILNAADFGVPQLRKRAIIVAWRGDVDFQWPTGKYSANPLTSWDALSKVVCENPPQAKGKWAGLLPSIPEGWNYLWHTARGEGRELFGYRTKFWSFLLKLSKDKPAWTLAAQPGPGTGPFHWDNRPLGAEELLALQTFPSTWKLKGTYRDQVKMIGNATPPLLAENLGRAICSTLLGIKVPPRKVHTLTRSKKIPPPELVADVPCYFLKYQRRYSAHPGAGKGPNPRLESQNPF